jgi:hypothetical protein
MLKPRAPGRGQRADGARGREDHHEVYAPEYQWVCCCRQPEESLEVAPLAEGNRLNGLPQSLYGGRKKLCI